MQHYTLLKDDETQFIKPKKSKITYSDTIYTFDCETTSMFFIDGKWQKFDYSRNADFYKRTEKRSCVWIWQFGVNDTYYYGRTPDDFDKLLKSISNKNIRKIIYVFNLSFEFQQFMEIFQRHIVTRMIAREVRKPISFLLEDLNIEFRCLYMLTNLSLENASKRYTNIEKAVGDLDYSIIRSPLTKNITPAEWHYIEYDLKCMYEILLYFKKKYDYIYKIPYTQTGEVRKAWKDIVPYWYIRRMKYLIPTVETFKILWACFQGGYTHSNMLWTDMIIDDICFHKDETSAYPAALVLYKYPSEPFAEVDQRYFNHMLNDDRYAKLMIIKMDNVKPKLYNHIISSSKCIDATIFVEDNGRIVSADSLTIVCNEIDLEMYKLFYSFDLSISKMLISRKDYLPKILIDFILDNYANKTILKGTPETDVYNYSLYMKAKQIINAIYGCTVQNVVKSTCDYGIYTDKITGIEKVGWNTPELSDDLIQTKLDEQKRPLFFYAWGVWCTSYNRRATQSIIAKIDSDEVYTDTDSIIYQGDHNGIFNEWNNYIIGLIHKSSTSTGIPIEKYMPKDKKGIPHPIGIYEDEEPHTEGFKTLGAKKYAYMENGKVHITVSGVRKKAGDYLHDLDEFTDGYTFTYEESGKLLQLYNDDQAPFTFTDCEGNEYHCTQKTASVLMPTTYNLSLNPDYDEVIEECKSGLYANKYFNMKERFKKYGV